MTHLISIHQTSLAGGLGFRKTAQTNLDLAELYSRTPFDPEARRRLQQATAVIFGVGSGGSRLAALLAGAEVGRVILIDPSRLQVHNVCRHAGSLMGVGRFKVDVVGDLMLLRNPNLVVDAYPLDLFAPEAALDPLGLIAEANVVVAATDKTEIQLEINRLTWGRAPAVFGGCYEAARGGEVFFTLPGEKMPCLCCLRGGLAQPARQGPFDYSAARTAQDYQGEPGLNAAVDFITDVEAQVVLGILLRGLDSALSRLIRPERNFLLVGGALAEGYYRFKRPFQIFWQPLAGPRPDCDVCGQPEENLPEPDLPTEPPVDFNLPF